MWRRKWGPGSPEDGALPKMEVTGICWTDVKMYAHPVIEAPVIMGHENVGTIVEAGRAFVEPWNCVIHEVPNVVTQEEAGIVTPLSNASSGRSTTQRWFHVDRAEVADREGDHDQKRPRAQLSRRRARDRAARVGAVPAAPAQRPRIRPRGRRHSNPRGRRRGRS